MLVSVLWQAWVWGPLGLRSKRFLTINCSAVVETLFESELFGHMRGAFTGATDNKAGLFEAADGGTLFLDEVGELPAAVQAKMLRELADFIERDTPSEPTPTELDQAESQPCPDTLPPGGR